MTKNFLLLSAVCILLQLTSCTGRSDHWLSLLEQAEERNRNDVPFTSDSRGLALVSHYDHWWHSRNLRMRAYYMLGSAYRDMGEAPAALHYYNMAVEQADTAHADSATYATLFRVYGQMAMIYEQQNLPYEELNALDSFCRYSLLAKDTLDYIIGEERKIISYYSIGDTLQVLKQTKKVRSEYLKIGESEYAARSYPTAIYVYLLRGEFTHARKLMDTFERQSGLFDEMGNIEKGNEQYYNSIGLYHLGTGNIDSAEYYFHKLWTSGYHVEACEGLLSVYRTMGNTDSIIKYTSLYKHAQEQWATSQQASAIIYSSAMYRYERNQNIAIRKEKDIRISHQIILFLLSILVIICMLVYIVFNRIKQQNLKKEVEYHNLVEEHRSIKQEYQQQCDKLVLLEHDFEELKRKEVSKDQVDYKKMQQDVEIYLRKIETQKEIINSYREEILNREDSLMHEEIVCLFREMAKGGFNKKKPTKKEWNKMVNTYKHYMPHIYARMQIAGLSQRELLASILTHLDFRAYELTILLDTSKQIVSNTRLSAKKKLFGVNDGLSLTQCLRKCAYLQV